MQRRHCRRSRRVPGEPCDHTNGPLVNESGFRSGRLRTDCFESFFRSRWESQTSSVDITRKIRTKRILESTSTRWSEDKLLTSRSNSFVEIWHHHLLDFHLWILSRNNPFINLPRNNSIKDHFCKSRDGVPTDFQFRPSHFWLQDIECFRRN